MRKLSILLLAVPFFLMGQNDNSSVINNVTHIKVKMGHDAQFMEGVKMYKKCYAENGGEGTWNFWNRVQGANSVYAVTDTMENWAEMDEGPDEAGSKCRYLFSDFILPHMEKMDYMITKSMPEISNDSTEPSANVWVTYFRVSNSSDFMDVVKAVSGAVKKAEGDERAYWYGAQGGGEQDADYLVAWPFENYAELDKDMDGVWTVYEKANGKKKTDEMRAKFDKSIDGRWSYIYSKNMDMSKTE
ncbi:hypothetical protein [Winogradskyella alexanderae]|uniref:NIPSNAP domain-containing protein n=1 Tax=Winogradskyella alexanderae TaxID=2877123 RepID=A0ABS7XUH8_9FLAO|nr:hypothetical protein [Winogradskyella alexanderae]MCA0133684.1 hypothetical protein [Winogradskyella alexanderae]